MLRLRSTGILNRIQKRAWTVKADENKTLWTSVSIDAVVPIFVILTIGVILATVLMLLERQVSAMMQRSSKRYRISNRRKPEVIRSGTL